MEQQKMKVEVWSDVMCPFCYIGKRHYEAALASFKYKDFIETEWKSFLLDPSIPTSFENPLSVYEYIAFRKGITVQQSKEMHKNVIEMASAAGLIYDFDKAILANSFKAHRLIQLAKQNGLGDAIEELLFEAYFTAGKDIADNRELTMLGAKAGISERATQEALSSINYAKMVEDDVAEAKKIGVNGVPFFVFNRRYAISGAQPVQTFEGTLEKAFAEWKDTASGTFLTVSGDASCDVEKGC